MLLRALRWTGLTRPAFLIGILLGLVGGAGGMLIGFPYLFPPPVLNEAAPEPALFESRKPIAFTFDESAPGRDFLHWANGTGRIIPMGDAMILRLEPNFTAAPGPDYHIYLSTRPVRTKADFENDPGRVELMRLRAFTGAQNYTLPATIGAEINDATRFHSVVIWCKTFKAYIGSAPLVR